MSFDAALLVDAITQSAATTGNGTEIQVNGGKLVKVYFVGAAGVTAGAVQLEEAIAVGYVGTWAPVGSTQTITGGQTDVLVFQGPFKALRTRISTTISGGGAPSVTVRVVIV